MAALEYTSVLGGGPGNVTYVQLVDGRIVAVQGDRAIRNNNPGNIRDAPATRRRGAIGADRPGLGTGFGVFPTRGAGLEAQASLIFSSPAYRDLTLAEAIARYAPPNENNTARYAATVSQMAGVPLDTRMRDIPAAQRSGVLAAMHEVEGNTSARVFDRDGTQIGRIDNSPTLDLRGSDQPAWGAIGARSMTGYAPGRPAAGTPAAGAMGARSMAGWGGFQPSTYAAPLGAPVERASLPSVADIAKAQAYGDYARSRTMSPSRPDNRNFAGPKGSFNVLSPEQDYFGPPVSIPKASTTVDPITVQANVTPGLTSPMAGGGTVTAPPAISPMADNTPVAPGFPSAPGFPAPPPAPGRKAAMEAGKGALGGMLAGGPLGAILGGLFGPARDQIMGNIQSNRQGMGRVGLLNGVLGSYRGLGGMFGNMGGLLSTPNFSASPYSIGSGYDAISGVFSAPAGATAYSRSNPNVSWQSLGNNMAMRTNAEYGTSRVERSEDYGGRSPSSKSSSKK